MGPGRLHALADGIFAIAVTLLVLDLPRPVGSSDLVGELLHRWPSYLAYVVSFATVGIIWIEHHGMMSAVQRINRRLLEGNLVLLLFVSVTPWPTALAAEYIRDEGDGARAAAVLYAALMLLMGLSMTLVWRMLAGQPELVVDAARPAMRAGVRRALIGALVYVPAIAVAFASPIASFAIDALIATYFALSRSAVPGLVAGSAPPVES